MALRSILHKNFAFGKRVLKSQSAELRINYNFGNLKKFLRFWLRSQVLKKCKPYGAKNEKFIFFLHF